KCITERPRAEALIISGLNDEDCHALCFQAPIAKCRRALVSTELPIWPTNIFCLNSQEGTLSKVSEPLDIDFDILKWAHAGQCEEAYRRARVRNPTLPVCHRVDLMLQKFWLAQANYIFAQLHRTSPLEDYVYIDAIMFILKCKTQVLGQTLEHKGYLFLCPPENFRAGHDGFRWPHQPAFWSFDSSGAVRLSAEDAKILGFPIIYTETHSREAAIDLRYPLYKLSNEEIPLAY
ncbi:hypothetical protein B0H14DRAFT_2837836, partial [Mycena olivaceomarginata]